MLSQLPLLAALAFGSAASASVEHGATQSLPSAIEAYKWFHAHPELSGEEEKTAAFLAEKLRKLDMTVYEGIGGHGIVAVMRGKGTKKGDPVVLYRADMDGLPIEEKTRLPFASTNTGVMHACGHDVHMATALGVLTTLHGLGSWRGTVIFVGQPAEETGSGAKAMLADSRFKEIMRKHGKPAIAFALHDAADLPAGHISILAGFHHANVDSVDILVHGKGGHGARPHETIDPIVIGSEIVMSLQTIVSRRIRPDEKAVVTVGKFSAGTKHNITPPTAELLLTVRSYGDKTRQMLLTEIQRVARQVAKAHRAPRAPDVRVRDTHVPATYNDPVWTKKVRTTFVTRLGADKVHEHKPSLGGEDFGLFGKQLGIPAIMWKLGGVDPQRWNRTKGDVAKLPGLHSDLWAPAASPTLKTGIVTMTDALLLSLAN